jgi:signal-transduction protein with cAMP-binding, CBS, and nucleotidyltransferase domain
MALLPLGWLPHHGGMFDPHGGGPAATLRDLHLEPPTTVAESDSLAVVARSFLDNRVSCAVLREPPLRVVTERDLAGAWSDGRSADDEVALISTTDPCWVPDTTTVVEAAAQMINLGVRHLVVLDVTGRPTGIVSMVALFSALIHNQEPLALYASFATVMLQGRSVLSGGVFTGTGVDVDTNDHLDDRGPR